MIQQNILFSNLYNKLSAKRTTNIEFTKKKNFGALHAPYSSGAAVAKLGTKIGPLQN